MVIVDGMLHRNAYCIELGKFSCAGGSADRAAPPVWRR